VNNWIISGGNQPQKQRYRARLDGEWIDVPDEAVITEPDRQNHGVAAARLSRGFHPLLHAGQHDVARHAERSPSATLRPRW
jgi:hypothetical protein